MTIPPGTDMKSPVLLKRLAWIVPLSLIVLYAIATLWFVIREESLVYPRTRELDSLAYGVTRLPVTLLTNDGLRLAAWAMPDTDQAASQVWVLFLHGNGGNVSTPMQFYSLLLERGVHILALDYRGYGQSDGDPTEPGLALDADAAYEYLVRQLHVPGRNIVLYGHSLGGAVAINLATYARASGLIVEGTFTSLANRVQEIYPIIPVKWIMKNRFDSIEKIPHVTIPKLFIHSANDDVVPIEHGRQLFAAASDPKEFLEVSGGHFTACVQDEEKFFGGVSRFIHEVTGATLRVPHPPITGNSQ